MNTALACRSDFSLGESILTTDYIVRDAKAASQSAVALTDTMSVTAMVNFSMSAKKEGLKPIIGTRLRLTDEPEWRPGPGQKKKDMPRTYVATIYARNEAGMKMIYRLLTHGNSEDRFYYEAKLGFEDLYKELDAAGNEDVTLIYGDMHSVLEHPSFDDIGARLKDTGITEIYAPLMPVDTPYFARLTELAVQACVKGFAKPIVLRTAIYERDSADYKEIITAAIGNHKITDPWFRSAHNRDFHIMTKEEITGELIKLGKTLKLLGKGDALKWIRPAIKNADDFPDLISYVWDKSPVTLPKLAPNEFEKVVAECKSGWAKRFSDPVFGHIPTEESLRDEYMPRLKYELGVLQKLDFSGYFLLVQDIVAFAKGAEILVGPGRGSVGGSLVAYLMGITECDPIRFGLLFERFINPDRIDLPDADLDFMAERRWEVFDYLYRTYGKDHAAGVSNYGSLGGASAIRDVAKAMMIPEREYAISKLVPKEHGQPVSLQKARENVSEIDEFANKYASAWDVIERSENNMRSFGQHAAGMVVAGEPLVNRGVIEHRKNGQVICWDKRIVEDQGLVKVDILGLKTLDLIGLALQYIKERYSAVPEIMKIPLDDPSVLKNFAEGNAVGVFQFESPGMRKLLREIGSTGDITFDDISACTALYRPGPMDSGMMDSFYLRKQGNESITYDHPLLEDVLKETFGVIVYQEQVMRISQVIAGYNGGEADTLRKIMGKKQPDQMAKQKGKFVEGCVKTIGATEQWAGALFDKIAGFAGYGFNKSHSVEYSLISYQSMYLKTHYPAEFYAAALSILDEDKLNGIVRDAKRAGIDISVPDINVSTNRFEIVTPVRLMMPFNRIKGISTRTGDAILEARVAGNFTSKADFIGRVQRAKCNIRHQETLDIIGAFSRIELATPPANDPTRIIQQIEHLPGLVVSTVPISRPLDASKISREFVSDVINDCRLLHGPTAIVSDGAPVMPRFGKRANFVIVMDAPSTDEEALGVMGGSKAATAIKDALELHGLHFDDMYWTSLIKRPKQGKQITQEELDKYTPYFERELEIVQSPIIVTLGTAATRYFLPDFKGKASDAAGQIYYDAKRDANIIVGFNPNELYFNPDKLENLVEVFASVVDLT